MAVLTTINYVPTQLASLSRERECLTLSIEWSTGSRQLETTGHTAGTGTYMCTGCGSAGLLPTRGRAPTCLLVNCVHGAHDGSDGVDIVTISNVIASRTLCIVRPLLPPTLPPALPPPRVPACSRPARPPLPLHVASPLWACVLRVA
jgi:hypothetical protein